MAILDRQLCYLQVNKVLAEINGRSVTSHLRQPITAVVPDLVEQQVAVFERILSTGEPVLNFEVTGETSFAGDR